MQIEALSVKSHTGLNIESMTFHDLTLLVGVSGSGKSQVLYYLKELTRLLCHQSFTPLPTGEYTLQFRWGEQRYIYHLNVDQPHHINGHLSTTDHQLSLPLQLNKLTRSIRLIQPVSLIRQTRLQKQSLNLSSPHILERLAYVYEYRSELFEEIRDLYTIIFEQVTDIKFQEEGNTYQLYLQEKSEAWVTQEVISDGMFKTLVYLSEIILSEPGTVLLIDEFENGLGLNCLGIMLDEMMQRRDIQLIVTSHHPYIINNVPTENWTVVMREGLMIHSKSAADLGIGQTKYDAFFELMNRLEYEGVL